MCDFNTNIQDECEAELIDYFAIQFADEIVWSNEYGGTNYTSTDDFEIKMITINNILYFKILPKHMEFSHNDNTRYDGYFIFRTISTENEVDASVRCLTDVDHVRNIVFGRSNVSMYI
jgi:hypothetical protein